MISQRLQRCMDCTLSTVHDSLSWGTTSCKSIGDSRSKTIPWGKQNSQNYYVLLICFSLHGFCFDRPFPDKKTSQQSPDFISVVCSGVSRQLCPRAQNNSLCFSLKPNNDNSFILSKVHKQTQLTHHYKLNFWELTHYTVQRLWTSYSAP